MQIYIGTGMREEREYFLDMEGRVIKVVDRNVSFLAHFALNDPGP